MTGARGARPPARDAEAAALWQALEARPWAHGFYATLRAIEATHPDKPRIGAAQKPGDEPVRFGQDPQLVFAPSTLAGLKPGAAGAPPRLEVNMLGFLGPNGPLPLHLTEFARDRLLHAKDAGFARFLDVFNHRFVSLFYRAWAQAQPVVSLDRPRDDRFADYVGTVFGLGAEKVRNREPVPDRAKLFFSGLLARNVRNGEGLVAILRGYFGMPVRVESYVGHWMRLAPAERTRLGVDDAGSRLGMGAVAGDRVWDRQHKFRLWLGPLDRDQFESFLPGNGGAAALLGWVREYLHRELAWDVRLELHANEVPRAKLGVYGRLGWTTWVGARPREHATDLVLDLEAIDLRERRRAARATDRSATPPE